MRELERRGYAILARRFRVRGGELDIVARDGSVLVFVEVKARAGRRFGEAAEAVTSLKQRRIAQLASEYLCVTACQTVRAASTSCRSGVGAGTPDVEVIQNAFDELSS